MSTTSQTPSETAVLASPRGDRATDPSAVLARRTTPAIKLWATLGGLWLAFIVYVLARWITGPYFHHVAAGPTAEPGWMRTAETAWEVVGALATIAVVYWFVVRPKLRDKVMSSDGLLVCAFATLWFEDPLSSYYGHWFTYNANLVNMGSWVKDVPGWNSFSTPGHMVLEPLLIIPFVYVYFIMIGVLIGCWAMRKFEERFHPSTLQLIGFCFVMMCSFDLVGEGFIFLPLGFWEYPGGYGLLFASTYHKYPINEMLTIGALFTIICCLRYFKNDRGQMLVERGVDKLKISNGGKSFVRFLAMLGGVHLALLLAYNLPNSWVGAHSRPWPADLQKRSYLNDGVCGEDTTRACPGPGIPLDRGNSTIHVSPTGKLVVPKGVKLPTVTPLAKH